MNPSSTPSASGGGTPRETAGEVRKAVSGVFSQAKERAATYAETQKTAAADHIGKYGTAFRDSARAVENDDPNVAYFANQAAERIERVADYVRGTDLEGLRHDAEDVARRHPVFFLGGMMVAGLALGYLIKASARGASQADDGGPDDGLGSGDDDLYPPPDYTGPAGGETDYDAAAVSAGASLGAAPGGLPPVVGDTPRPGQSVKP